MPHKGRAVTRTPLATDFPPPEKYPNQARLSTDTDGFGGIHGTRAAPGSGAGDARGRAVAPGVAGGEADRGCAAGRDAAVVGGAGHRHRRGGLRVAAVPQVGDLLT